MLCKVHVSYLEVYEGRVYDLLNVSNRDKSLEEWATLSMTTDSEGAQFIKGLTTYEVESEGEKLTKS